MPVTGQTVSDAIFAAYDSARFSNVELVTVISYRMP